VNITIEGQEILDHKLVEIREKLKGTGLIGKVGLVVQRQMIQNASTPSGSTINPKTGKSRSAFTISEMARLSTNKGPHARTSRLRGSINLNVKSYDTATVGPTVYYAPFVEFGHKQEVGRYVPAIGARLVNPTAPAYPFVTPVPGQVKDQLEGVFVSFGNEIKDVWSK
jgi:hypothetical protein